VRDDGSMMRREPCREMLCRSEAWIKDQS
jgi:hypothetical protein